MKSPQANIKKAIRETPRLKTMLKETLESYDRHGVLSGSQVEDCRTQIYLIASLLDEIMGEEV